MADELDPHTGTPIELLLEGQDDEHTVDEAGDLPDPPLAPGPDLRADEVEDRDAGAARAARETEVEVGIVDQEDQIGPGARLRLLEGATRLAVSLHDDPERAQD